MEKRNKKNLMIVGGGIVILIILLLFGLKGCENDKPTKITGGGEEPAEKITEITTINDMIQFPTLFGKYEVNKDNPYVTVTNPEINDVLMKFTYKIGDEVLCASDWIAPSKSYNGNVYEHLPVGTHSMHIVIDTIDIATQVPCTGVVARADVIVTK